MKEKRSLIEQLEYNTQEYVKNIEGKPSKTKTFKISVTGSQINDKRTNKSSISRVYD